MKFVFPFILIFTVFFGCKANVPAGSAPTLELIDSYNLNVDEPSGLDLTLDNKSLWAVSDKRSKMYKLDLAGQILQEISIPGTDLEGITIDSNDNTLWVVLESVGEILQVDSLGNEIQRKTIAGVRDGSGGLEGVTLNSTSNHLLLLKEKDPGALLELNTAFETIVFKRIAYAQDYSGIDYDKINDELWIVSDQERTVYKCDLSGTVIESYPIDVDKAEGIAVDSENNLIYIVSDSEDRLYVFSVK